MRVAYLNELTSEFEIIETDTLDLYHDPWLDGVNFNEADIVAWGPCSDEELCNATDWAYDLRDEDTVGVAATPEEVEAAGGIPSMDGFDGVWFDVGVDLDDFDEDDLIEVIGKGEVTAEEGTYNRRSADGETLIDSFAEAAVWYGAIETAYRAGRRARFREKNPGLFRPNPAITPDPR